MNIIKVESYDEMSQKAAELIIEKVKNVGRMNLGLATGGTPKGLYQKLVEDHKANGTSYKEVTTFNLDEYVGLSATHPNSYNDYMNRFLFNHINIDKSNTHLPNGLASDLEKECKRYEANIDASGGIDLQVLGIGENGHIGFNEPGTSFDSRTHVVKLEESTRKANSRYFQAMDEVPTHAITMGIATIMKSKEILLLVSGARKAKAMHRLLNGEVSSAFPASILKQHRNVTIVADHQARSGG
ncbi:glucosamine-6-phosphate deaminase [Halalkalibacterium ligniniphilum]|uniref:glucosamine-6-phosphate deaminase n=2 Tax=Halalkalibacterium ligniniphilum TaxID=1134413 RepID=UPI000347483E|nr:glucosamine-6-phosphate deaminase [Halalkalibacterium ligniniphilum]